MPLSRSQSVRVYFAKAFVFVLPLLGPVAAQAMDCESVFESANSRRSWAEVRAKFEGGSTAIVEAEMTPSTRTLGIQVLAPAIRSFADFVLHERLAHLDASISGVTKSGDSTLTKLLSNPVVPSVRPSGDRARMGRGDAYQAEEFSTPKRPKTGMAAILEKIEQSRPRRMRDDEREEKRFSYELNPDAGFDARTSFLPVEFENMAKSKQGKLSLSPDMIAQTLKDPTNFAIVYAQRFGIFGHVSAEGLALSSRIPWMRPINEGQFEAHSELMLVVGLHRATLEVLPGGVSRREAQDNLVIEVLRRKFAPHMHAVRVESSGD